MTFQKLSELSRELERKSSVEMVVVVARQSGEYGDLDHRLAFIVSTLVLAFLIHSPLVVHPDWVVVIVVAAALLTLPLASRLGELRRRSAPERRRRAQVLQAARAAFVEERVGSTRERTGVLLYLSQFEQMAVLVTDLGVDAAVPAGLLNPMVGQWAGRDVQSRLEADLPRLADIFAERLPRAADDADELSNEVVLR